MPKDASGAAAVVAAGGRRLLLRSVAEPKKVGKWYPTDDVPAPAKRAHKPATAKLRSSITPGAVLILVAGRYQGRRVVFLKQLPSGLLLVTGPLAANGVPLRRVNQAYVIATSASVDVSRADVSAIGDEQFSAAADKATKKKGLPVVKRDAVTGKKDAKEEEAFFVAAKKLRGETSDASKALQARVDGGIKLDATMSAYLKARFALTKGQRPHEMKW